MMFYLAGPIDGVNQADARSWRAAVASILTEAGHTAFNPATAWHMNAATDASNKQIDQVNRAAVCLSDGIIANLCGVGLGLGTAREIEYARSEDLPVLAFVPPNYLAVALHDLSVRYWEPDKWNDHLRLRSLILEWVQKPCQP